MTAESTTAPVRPDTELDPNATYRVIAVSKDTPDERRTKITGAYDECAAYAERNHSPDNPERYEVHVKAPSR